jgi:hypothetical protein
MVVLFEFRILWPFPLNPLAIRGSRGNSKFKRASYSLLDRNRLLRGKRNTHVIVIKGYILLSLLLSLSLFYASTDEEEEEEEEEGIKRNT